MIFWKTTARALPALLGAERNFGVQSEEELQDRSVAAQDRVPNQLPRPQSLVVAPALKGQCREEGRERGRMSYVNHFPATESAWLLGPCWILLGLVKLVRTYWLFLGPVKIVTSC